MTETTNGRIAALYRYPVKGLTPEPLERVQLKAGATVPFDRAYAIENGPTPFDAAAPRYLAKIHFVMLMRNEQLATLESRFDDATQILTIFKDGARLAAGNLATVEGRAPIEAVIAETVGAGLRGAPRIVSSPGHSFSDVAAKCVHIINLASLRELEGKMGAGIDPRRFRPNIVVDGLPAWSEFDLVGKAIEAGPVRLEVFKRTERCAATNVDPVTAVRDLKIPSFLSRTYGHSDFGVYARVATEGSVARGDAVATGG